MKQMGKLVYFIFCVCTAMVSYEMYHNVGWAIIDFIFAPLALVYWLFMHEINITIIKQTFEFFWK